MAGVASFTSTSKIEQIVAEFFAKCLHVILDSRISCTGASSSSHPGKDSPASSASSSSGMKSKDRWFHLVLGDCPSAQESLEAWRRSMADSMVIDILLVRSPGWHGDSPRKSWGSSPGRNSWSEGGTEDSYGTVLERWIISHERSTQGGSGSSSGSERRLEVPGVYKRAVILMRTLYSSARLLPAYRLFHLSNSSSHSRSFSLAYKLSASPSPLLEADEAAMAKLNLASVETPTGRLCVSVAYRHTTAITALEVTPPVLPRIISDYVGSPTTDPLRRVPTESLTGSAQGGGISGRRGVHVVSLPTSAPGSPAGIARRHSWGGGVNKLQPALLPPSSPSFKSSRSSSPSQQSPPQYRSPLHYITHPQSCPASQPIPIHHDRRPSPPNPCSFSPPSTSHSLESSLARLLPKQASAPVSIPKSSGLRDKSSLPPPSPSPRRSFDQPGSSAGRTVPRLSASTLAESLLVISPPYPYQDDTVEGPPSGLKRSLYGSPRVSLSRSSSSRMQDEAEDEEFSCPFAVDDDEAEEIRSRSGSPRNRPSDVFEASGPKSHHAALGALVRQLRLAPPLYGSGSLDEVVPSTGSSKSRPIPGAHRLHRRQSLDISREPNRTLKSIGEAVEELELYQETRKFFLGRQGGRKCTEKHLPPVSPPGV